MILGELCMGGMVLDTNMSEIITRVEEQGRLEKAEVSVAAACVSLLVFVSVSVSGRV